jgi:hypothetical protein
MRQRPLSLLLALMLLAPVLHAEEAVPEPHVTADEYIDSIDIE